MGLAVESGKNLGTARAYVFGPFRLVPSERILLRDGEPEALTPKAFDLLRLLVESAGHLLTREELIRALWPTTVVEEANLSWNVRAARKALGDEGDAPRYIETVRGHGYRFIAPVTEESPADPGGAGPGSRRRRGWIVAATGAVLLAAAALAAILWWPRPFAGRRTTAGVRGRPAVAVLGFQNLSADRRAEWVGTALTEMVGTDLAAGGELRTAPAMDVARVRREFNLPAGGAVLNRRMLGALHDNLGAGYVATGAYLLLGSGDAAQLRVDVKLIDTASGSTVAALSETGSRGELFDLVRSIGIGLRERLGVASLSSAEESEVRASIPASPGAARAYADGLRALEAGDAVGARKSLEAAVAAEPDFPLAYVRLAQAWLDLGDEVNARAAAQKALANAAGLSRPQKLLIDGLYREAGHEWGQAVQDYRALFTFYPDDLQYGLLLARAQANAGRLKDSLATVATLRKLPPPAGNDPRVDLAEAYSADDLGDNQRAATAAARAAATAKVRGATLLQAEALSHLGRTDNLIGRYAEAAAHLGEARRLYEQVGGDALGLGITLERLGNLHDAQGDYAAAVRIYADAGDIFARVGNRYWQGAALNNIGNVYYHRNQLDKAQHYYELALPMFRDIHRDLTASYVLNNLAVISDDRGDAAGAIKNYREALALRRAAGAEAAEADTLLNLGHAYWSVGEFEQAHRVLNEAMAIYVKEKDEPDQSYVMAALADIDVQKDRLAAARRGYAQALAIRKAKGMGNDTAEAERDLAEVALLTGDPELAEKFAEPAVAGYRSEKAGTDEARARAVLGLAYLGEGRENAARAQLRALERLYPSIESGDAKWNLDIQTARLQAGLGDTEAAVRSLRATIDGTAKLGLTTLAYQARLALARVEAGAGLSDRARGEVGRLAEEAGNAGYLLVAREANALLVSAGRAPPGAPASVSRPPSSRSSRRSEAGRRAALPASR